MSITVAGQGFAHGDPASSSTVQINVTGSNSPGSCPVLVAHVGFYEDTDDHGTVTSITDANNLVWSRFAKMTQPYGGVFGEELWWTVDTVGQLTAHTFTFNFNRATYNGVNITAWNGVDNSFPFDTHPSTPTIWGGYDGNQRERQTPAIYTNSSSPCIVQFAGGGSSLSVSGDNYVLLNSSNGIFVNCSCAYENKSGQVSNGAQAIWSSFTQYGATVVLVPSGTNRTGLLLVDGWGGYAAHSITENNHCITFDICTNYDYTGAETIVVLGSGYTINIAGVSGPQITQIVDTMGDTFVFRSRGNSLPNMPYQSMELWACELPAAGPTIRTLTIGLTGGSGALDEYGLIAVSIGGNPNHPSIGCTWDNNASLSSYTGGTGATSGCTAAIPYSTNGQNDMLLFGAYQQNGLAGASFGINPTGFFELGSVYQFTSFQSWMTLYGKVVSTQQTNVQQPATATGVSSTVWWQTVFDAITTSASANLLRNFCVNVGW